MRAGGWPRQESLVFPGSHGPSWGHAIGWHTKLRVLGWLLLRGRCRDCDAEISWRYPAVEALSAGLWISALLVWPGAGGGLPDLLLPWTGFPLIALLLPLVLIDLDHLWLPEPLCRWGVVLGLLVSTAAGIPVLASHLIAAVLALLLLEGLSALAERLLGQPALGLGDAKLAALGGAWLGPGGIAAAMAIAITAGAVVGGGARLGGRLVPREPFPFGPFIASGIWLVLLTGPLWWWRAWLMLLGA